MKRAGILLIAGTALALVARGALTGGAHRTGHRDTLDAVGFSPPAYMTQKQMDRLPVRRVEYP